MSWKVHRTPGSIKQQGMAESFHLCTLMPFPSRQIKLCKTHKRACSNQGVLIREDQSCWPEATFTKRSIPAFWSWSPLWAIGCKKTLTARAHVSSNRASCTPNSQKAAPNLRLVFRRIFWLDYKDPWIICLRAESRVHRSPITIRAQITIRRNAESQVTHSGAVHGKAARRTGLWTDCKMGSNRSNRRSSKSKQIACSSSFVASSQSPPKTSDKRSSS
jgi:hypothetical protein